MKRQRNSDIKRIIPQCFIVTADIDKQGLFICEMVVIFKFIIHQFD